MASTAQKEESRPRRPPEHVVKLLAAPWCVKDSVKGILHTIFFHRIFGHIRPLDRDINFLPASLGPSDNDKDLTITLPLVDDPDLESTVADRANTLQRRIDKTPTSSIPARDKHVTLAVHFYEKKRKKATGFANFWNPTGASKGNGDAEKVCWESWSIEVTVMTAVQGGGGENEDEVERIAERCARSLREAAIGVIEFAGTQRDHIPPITTDKGLGFPFEIVVGSVDSS